jgi:hypothetical protein
MKYDITCILLVAVATVSVEVCSFPDEQQQSLSSSQSPVTASLSSDNVMTSLQDRSINTDQDTVVSDRVSMVTKSSASSASATSPNKVPVSRPPPKPPVNQSSPVTSPVTSGLKQLCIANIYTSSTNNNKRTLDFGVWLVNNMSVIPGYQLSVVHYDINQVHTRYLQSLVVLASVSVR